MKLGAGGVELQLELLRAILLGGIAFDTPDGCRSAVPRPAPPDTSFPLFADRDAAKAASYSRKIPAVSYFPGSVRGLAAGSEVTMHGLMVGHVTDVQLVYDRGKGRHRRAGSLRGRTRTHSRRRRKGDLQDAAEAVDAVVNRGLRATLQSASLITGQQVVALDFVRDAPPATVTMDGPDFVLPTTEGGGFAGLQASATALLDKVNTIPFKQIGDNLDGILRSANDVANGPQMKKALTDLSSTIGDLNNLVGHLDSGMSPALQQLPDIAAGLQKTLTSVNKLALSLDSGYGDNTQFNRDLERLLVQVNDALRSIRSLADLLARHPEALIKGRPAGGVE